MLNYMIFEVIEKGYISDFISGESEAYKLEIIENTVEFTIYERTYRLPKYEFFKSLLEESKYYIEFHNKCVKDKHEQISVEFTQRLLSKVESFK